MKTKVMILAVLATFYGEVLIPVLKSDMSCLKLQQMILEVSFCLQESGL